MDQTTRRSLIAAGALVATIGAGLGLGYRDLGRLRAQEGAQACRAVLYADNPTLERLNVADGLMPRRPFSLDDYCGAQCRPDSFRWAACVDSCVDECTEAGLPDNTEERD